MDRERHADVVLYTLAGCVHCARARRLLRRCSIQYREIAGDEVPDFRRRLLELTGGATVPQVMIDDEPVGGASRLAELDRRRVLVARVQHRRFPWPVVRRRPSLRRLLRWLASPAHRRQSGVWLYRVELRERDGRTVAVLPVASAIEAARLVEAPHQNVVGASEDV